MHHPPMPDGRPHMRDALGQRCGSDEATPRAPYVGEQTVSPIQATAIVVTEIPWTDFALYGAAWMLIEASFMQLVLRREAGTPQSSSAMQHNSEQWPLEFVRNFLSLRGAAAAARDARGARRPPIPSRPSVATACERRRYRHTIKTKTHTHATCHAQHVAHAQFLHTRMQWHTRRHTCTH